MKHFRFLIAGVLALSLQACGLADTVGSIVDALESRIAELTGVSDETFAVASELMTDGDTAIAATEDEDEIESIQDELDVAAAGDIGSLAAFSPALAAGDHDRMADRTVERTCYQSNNCLTGRVRTLKIVESFERGPASGRVVDIFFQYSSSPTEGTRGDMNESDAWYPRAGTGTPAYVYAEVTVTTSFRDADVAPAVIEGWRHWHEDPAKHYLFFDLTQTMPDDPRAPYATMHWYGGWDVASDAPGAFTREIVFADERTDLRTWTVDETVDDGGSISLDVTYNRTAPDGLTASGQGTWDLSTTRHCRLDDSGQFTLVRNFPAADTTDAYAVSETVVWIRDGVTSTVNGTLTLSDDSTRTRSMVRTIELPTSCDDEPLPRQVVQEGTTYRGVTVETTIQRDAGSLLVESSRTKPDGSTIEAEVARADGVGTVQITHTASDGTTLAELVLTVQPGGQATGTLTRYLDDGTVEVIDIERDIRGDLRMHHPNRPRDQFRRINRGEL
ncbi:MAG: hypothetical protein D6761_02905 [Candidatus Dadabacteria bacterium]|nr:MAG: hypothetical protein D6761_02905 [Candidatus Dadabacteria bacterium]